MPYTVEDYRRHRKEEVLKTLTPEDIFEFFRPEELLRDIPSEERLRGLSEDEIEECLKILMRKRRKKSD